MCACHVCGDVHTSNNSWVPQCTGCSSQWTFPMLGAGLRDTILSPTAGLTCCSLRCSGNGIWEFSYNSSYISAISQACTFRAFFFPVALNNLFVHMWLPWYHPYIVPKDWVQDSLLHSLPLKKRHSFLPTPLLQQQSGIVSVWWSFVSRPPSRVVWNWNSFACKAPRIW